MKSNELRIGNWGRYHHNGGFIDAQIFHLTDEDINVLPIELSPEILKKCGFEYSDDNESFDIRLHTYGMISIDKDDFSFFLGDNHNELGFVGGIKSCVKYVHQLQNLYFALTGEELNIKL